MCLGGRTRTSLLIFKFFLKNHPYITASLLATLLAIVVWFVVPKEYAAITRVSDEYKETDLAIGINPITARINKALNTSNSGINDIEVYCKTLKTADFARAISKTKISDTNVTYGEWIMQGRHFWQSEDTLELICDNIEYNISGKNQTLAIQFTDRDPLVASKMLDATTKHLQNLITVSRHKMADAALQNADKQRKEALEEYTKAQEKEASYSDSHFDTESEEETQQQKNLQGEVDLTYQNYQKATESYIRQISLKQRSYCSFAVIRPNVVPNEDTSHLWAYIGVFVLIALVVTRGYRLLLMRISEHKGVDFGGIFSPWSLTLLVWGGMMILFMLWGDELYPLTQQFYVSITLWVVGLTASSFITYNLLHRNSDMEQTISIDINKFVFYMLLIMSLIMSPWLLYKVYQTVSAFDSKDLMRNVRILAVEGGGQGFLNFSQLLSQVTFVVSIWAYPKVRMWVVALSVFCCICCSVALMEKGTIFLVIISGLYVMYCRKVIRVRTIGIVLLSLVGLFFLFNVLREGEDSDYSKNETLMGFVGMYIMSPPVAFCTISQDISDLFGINTFSAVYDYLQRFGIVANVAIHDKMQEFVCVPVTTNVYTIMQPFFRDFGYWGVAFFSVVYGVISGFLYRNSQNGIATFKCLYTYMVNILVLQFFQDNLFLSLSFCIQFAIVVTICTFRSVRIRV